MVPTTIALVDAILELAELRARHEGLSRSRIKSDCPPPRLDHEAGIAELEIRIAGLRRKIIHLSEHITPQDAACDALIVPVTAPVNC